MEEQPTQPTNNPRIALSSEERIASILLDSLEVYHKFMSISLGLEDYSEQQLSENSYFITSRRVSSLIKAANALSNVISVAKPTLSQLQPKKINDDDNDCLELGAIKHFLNQILRKIDMAEKTPTRKDDLIVEKEIGTAQGYNYSVKSYRLTDNFWKLIRELESYYDSTYTILLRNGLLTKLSKPETTRRRLNEI